MPSTVEIGREGERLARQLLERKGYQILEQNWHWHHYELDLVARQGDELVIVEVKTRGVDFLVDPEESIDQGKIRRNDGNCAKTSKKKNVSCFSAGNVL